MRSKYPAIEVSRRISIQNSGWVG